MGVMAAGINMNFLVICHSNDRYFKTVYFTLRRSIKEYERGIALFGLSFWGIRRTDRLLKKMDAAAIFC